MSYGRPQRLARATGDEATGSSERSATNHIQCTVRYGTHHPHSPHTHSLVRLLFALPNSCADLSCSVCWPMGRYGDREGHAREVSRGRARRADRKSADRNSRRSDSSAARAGMLPLGQPSYAFQQCGNSAPLAAARGRALPGAGGFSEGAPSQVSANARCVVTERLEKEISLVKQPLLKAAMTQVLLDLQQGKLPGFRLLHGALPATSATCAHPGSAAQPACVRARARV